MKFNLNNTKGIRLKTEKTLVQEDIEIAPVLKNDVEFS
jgi:hypothetical protein